MKRTSVVAGVIAVVIFGMAATHAQETGTPAHHPGITAAGEVPRFKFAVITDRHGGRKPGSTILEEAVNEINLIDPDFVISVGDLIDGYTDNVEEIRKQWDEFDADIRRLRRPLYYVFGNHDASNPVMIDALRKRYGSPYYSFNHKGCHFIVLFTETHDAQGNLVDINADAGQFEWLKKDLEANRDVVHTFVFFHKPRPAEGVLDLFKGRPTTVFAGHWHTYKQFRKDGINYHVLSSTGGGINADFYQGNFYHYVLVTVSGREVTPAVVRVGAIHRDDLLSQERLNKIAAARDSLATAPCTVPKGATGLHRSFEFRLPNPLPSPAKGTIEWTVPAGSTWNVTPKETDFVLKPNGETTLRFNVTCAEDPFATSLAMLPRFHVRAFGGRALSVHSPTVAGLDPLYNTTGTLVPDRWPYAENLTAFRQSVTIPTIPLEGALTKPVLLTVKNPFDGDIKASLGWVANNPKWKVTPEQFVADIRKGASVEARFTLAFSGRADEVFPIPRFIARVKCNGELVFDESLPLPIDAGGFFKGVERTAVCRALREKPRLDGRTADRAWQDRTRLGDFILVGGRAEPTQPTDVCLGTTDEGLWLAFSCREPEKNRARPKCSTRDSAVWEDDSVEIFLDTNFDRKTYYQFILNTAGVQYDGKEKDSSWNGVWQVKTAWTDGGWTAEVFIPWTTLGGRPAAGTRWGLNLARNRTVDEGGTSMWSPTLGSAHSPERFGTLVFE